MATSNWKHTNHIHRVTNHANTQCYTVTYTKFFTQGLIQDIHKQGSHPTWKTLNFVIFFSRHGKGLELAQKIVKTWNFNLKPGKKPWKFANSIFQTSLFKMSFTIYIILTYFFVISTLSTQILIRSEIDLGFHFFYLEITLKIHGILCHKRSGNPASVLTHFKIFITKFCMKVPVIWHT